MKYTNSAKFAILFSALVAAIAGFSEDDRCKLNEGSDIATMQKQMLSAKAALQIPSSISAKTMVVKGNSRTDEFSATGDLDQIVGTGTLTFRFNVNVPYTEITSVQLVINAYDVDYPRASEHDKIYFNGSYVARLTGQNNAYVETSYALNSNLVNIPSREGESAVNTFQLAVNVDNNGWVTGVGYAKLRITGRVFTLEASKDDSRWINVKWTNIGGCYDLYRRETQNGNWLRIATNTTDCSFQDKTATWGFDYYYYAVSKGEATLANASVKSSSIAKDSEIQSNIGEGLLDGNGTEPSIEKVIFPRAKGWLRDKGTKRLRIKWNKFSSNFIPTEIKFQVLSSRNSADKKDRKFLFSGNNLTCSPQDPVPEGIQEWNLDTWEIPFHGPCTLNIFISYDKKDNAGTSKFKADHPVVKDEHFNIYFEKYENDVETSINWYKYWKEDGAIEQGIVDGFKYQSVFVDKNGKHDENTLGSCCPYPKNAEQFHFRTSKGDLNVKVGCPDELPDLLPLYCRDGVESTLSLYRMAASATSRMTISPQGLATVESEPYAVGVSSVAAVIAHEKEHRTLACDLYQKGLRLPGTSNLSYNGVPLSQAEIVANEKVVDTFTNQLKSTVSDIDKWLPYFTDADDIEYYKSYKKAANDFLSREDDWWIDNDRDQVLDANEDNKKKVLIMTKVGVQDTYHVGEIAPSDVYGTYRTYGDNEIQARAAESTVGAHPDNDWGFPGHNITPPHNCKVDDGILTLAYDDKSGWEGLSKKSWTRTVSFGQINCTFDWFAKRACFEEFAETGKPVNGMCKSSLLGKSVNGETITNGDEITTFVSEVNESLSSVWSVKYPPLGAPYACLSASLGPVTNECENGFLSALGFGCALTNTSDISSCGTIKAYLVDADEVSYVSVSKAFDYTNGVLFADFIFDGALLSKYKGRGYHVGLLEIWAGAGDTPFLVGLITNLPTTATYDYDIFEKGPAVIVRDDPTMMIDDTGLNVDVGVEINGTNVYSLGAWIATTGGTDIVYAECPSITAGVTNVGLQFPLETVSLKAKEGPYIISEVMLKNAAGEIADYVAKFTNVVDMLPAPSNAYLIVSRESCRVLPIVRSADGFVDHVETAITVTNCAEVIEADVITTIKDTNGVFVCMGTMRTEVKSGENVLTVSLPLASMTSSGIDGPYTVTSVLINPLTNTCAAVIVYPNSSVPLMLSDLGTRPFSIDGEVTNSSGTEYEPINVSIPISVLRDDTVTASMIVVDANSNFVTRVETNVVVFAGERRTINIAVSAISLLNAGNGGPYSVSYLLLRSSIEGVDDLRIEEFDASVDYHLTIHVDPDNGDDLSDGLTSNTAKKSLKTALQMAVPGVYVSVKKGDHVCVPNDGDDACLVIGKGVTLIASDPEPGKTRIVKGVDDVRGVWLANGAALVGFSLSDYSLSAGGGSAIYGQGESSIVSNCVISGCSATHDGGAVYQCSVYDSILSGNSAQNGGAAASCKVINCTIKSNKATNNGGGLFECSADGCKISGNTARYYGGGACFGTIKDCYVVNNFASSMGGGIANANVFDSAIVGNHCGDVTTSGVGGGIAWSDSGFVAERCYVAENNARSGSAIYHYDYSGNSSFVRDSIIVHNTARLELALFCSSPRYGIKIERCTVADNDCAPSELPGTYYASAYDSIIYYNYARPDTYRSQSCYGLVSNCCTTVEGSSCIEYGTVKTEPAFVDREHRVYDLTAAVGENIVGAGKAVDLTDKFVVGVEIVGHGAVLQPGAVVDAGESRTFVAAEIGRAFEGFYTNGMFATMERQLALNDIRENIIVQARFQKRTAYVSESGSDDNDGLTASTPKRTINAAVALVENDEAIEVAAGRYAPVKSYGKRIRIYSPSGAEATIIDADGSGHCADLADFYSGTTNTVLVGFTLAGGYAENGAGAYYGTLDRCIVENNEAIANGGGTYFTTLHNTIVRKNRAVAGGGCYYGNGYNVSVCGNVAESGCGTCYGYWYNSIVRGNHCGAEESNYLNDAYYYSYTYPARSWGENCADDPMVVDAWNGDVRLLSGSPCVDAGCNDYVATSSDINGAERILNDVVDVGAMEGSSVAGNVVSVHVDGGGSVSNTTFVVSAGGTVTIVADETVRPLDCFDVGGVRYTDNPLTLSDVASNIQVSAVFQRYTFYVDANVPSSGDGLSWESAFKTLQEGVDAALEDETVFVADGTYDSITTHNKKITIEGVNGATKTFINGQGSARCAMLGDSTSCRQTHLVGFTLHNGYAPISGSSAYGGGTYGGTVERCVISNCQAKAYYAYGGGSYYGTLKNCLIVNNTVVPDGYGYGGGACYSMLYNCTVVGNVANGGSSTYGGGTFYGSAYNSIVVGNGASYGDNSRYTGLYYCCTDKSATNLGSGTITDDPLFADADAGDYHLSPGSPCLNTGSDYYCSTDQDLDGKRRIQSGAVDMGCYEGATYTEAPGEVSGVTASGGKLIWDPLVAAASYLVYRSETDDEYDAVLVGASATAEYEDMTAEEGVTYWYWVRAVNPLGMGPMGEASEMVWPDPLEIVTDELPEGTEGESYEIQLEATGGTGDYSWSIVSDTGCAEKYGSTSTFEKTGVAQGWRSSGNDWYYELPFSFSFYGEEYDYVYVGSHGILSFDGYISGNASEDYLSSRQMVAGYWNWLRTDVSGCDIFVDEGEDYVSFRWVATHNNGVSPVNFSITLYMSGAIRLSYGEGNAYGGMIGYSAGDGENYYISSYSQSGSMENADDIWFFADLPPGITLSEDGVLSGDCSLVWDSEFTLAVEDELGETAEMTYSLVINENPNARPVISAVSPDSASAINVRIGESQTFGIEANDPEEETLQHFWYLDDIQQEVSVGSTSFTYSPTLADHGSHTLTCYVSDGYWTNKVFAAWQINACYDIYVDANVAEPGDGYAWATAMKSLNVACTYAVDGDRIFVADGTYEPISTADKAIVITSVNGAGVTFIDGGNSNRCARLSTANTGTNTVLEGFTLINGYQGNSYYVYGGGSWGGTLNYCVISNCHIVASTGNNGYDGAYGGASYYGVLNNCLVVGNSADSPYYARGGGLCYSTVRNCTIVGNSVSGGTTTRGTEYGYGGGSYGGTAYNSIFAYNFADIGTNAYHVSMYYCCAPDDSTYNWEGLITSDPQFVDAEAGDYRLLANSPCRQAGNNNYVIGDKDLAGDDRILRDTVNMGCFEEVVFTAIPEAVTGVIASEGALAWDGQLQADAYRVYRNTTDDFTGAALVLTTRSTAWEDESIVRDGAYWYWVVAVNDLGESSASASTKMLWPKPIVITTESLPAGVENEPYSIQLTATEGTQPYAWQLLTKGYAAMREDNSFVQNGEAQGWRADDRTWEYDLPFEFTFYGVKYNKVYVSSNGYLVFGEAFSQYYADDSDFEAHPMICGCWRDLYTNQNEDDDIFVAATGDAVTFRWSAVSSDTAYNFAITLSATGEIKVSYGSGNAYGGYVGVSAGDGVNFTLVSTAGTSLDNAADVVFKAGGWIAADDSLLPRGLTLSEDGILSGRPMEAYSNEVTVAVTDFNGWTTNKTFELVIEPNPNLRPVIDVVTPSNAVTYVLAGETGTFGVAARDPEGAEMSYVWYLDGDEVEDATSATWTYAPTTDEYGYHEITCSVSDGTWFDEVTYTWTVKVVCAYYVDPLAEGEETGETLADAFTSIEEAMDYAETGDVIYLATGTYEPFQFRSENVTVKALDGCDQTIIDCEGDYGVQSYYDYWRPEYETDGYDVQQPILEGVTIKNATTAAYGIKLVNSKIIGVTYAAAQGCQLENCIITQNTAPDALFYQCRLTGCSVVGNQVGVCALGDGCRAYNCIVSGNCMADGTEANYANYPSYEWDGENYVPVSVVQFSYSCTYPLPSTGTGNIDVDPLFVDARNGDLRLRVGSPCIDAASVQYVTALRDINGNPRVRDSAPDMGAIEGTPVEGLVISTEVVGGGSITPKTAVVAAGSDASFAADDTIRPFLRFETNGVWATSSTNFTWRNICADGTLTAVFSNFTFYVDAESGDDGNDGLSWATAKCTLQDAVAASLDGETIFVRAGEYAPISTDNKKISIIAVDGADETIIDGASSERCATLSESSVGTNTTLVGFTLRNGYAYCGGGAYGGTLRDCVITANRAIEMGGGCAYSHVHNSQIIGNSVVVPTDTDEYGNYTYSSWQAAGGGAYNGYLVNCEVLQNEVDGNSETSYVYGGGVAYSTVIGCVIAENTASGYCCSVMGGGVCDSSVINCTIVKNAVQHDPTEEYEESASADGGGFSGDYYSCVNSIICGNTVNDEENDVGDDSYYVSGCIVGEDPGFVDYEGGDYSVGSDSPCVDSGYAYVFSSWNLPECDIAGNLRVQGESIDIGAYEVAQEFYVERTSIELNSVEQEYGFAFRAASAWTAESSASWVSIAQNAGSASSALQSITLTVDENDTGLERTANITLHIGASDIAITVTQLAKVELPTASMRYYGLFVGLNEYLYVSSLNGCVPDAYNMMARCLSHGYWNAENVTALTDDQATKDAVREKIAQMARVAEAGDVVVFFQSSHGGNVTDAYGNQTDDVFLCEYDSYYYDYELAEDLSAFKAGVKLVVVVDACHSGGLFKAIPEEDALVANGVTIDNGASSSWNFAQRIQSLMKKKSSRTKSLLKVAAKDDTIDPSEIGWMTACDSDQVSYDTSEGGMFTGAMLDGWETGYADGEGYGDGDGYLNFYELFKYARERATGYGDTDAQCLNEGVLIKTVVGVPDGSDKPALPGLPEALDATNVTWVTGFGTGWFAQSDVTHDGDSAAQSGAIGHAASSVLNGTVSGSGTLSFWWKVSSEANRDKLNFSLDGEGHATISGEQDWQQVTIAIEGDGEHLLTWAYAKSKSGIAGSDCGWVDGVVWTPDIAEEETEVTLVEALDTTNVVWSTSGNASWQGMDNGIIDFARSGVIEDDEESVLSTTLVGPGELSFRWKTSCEEYDGLDLELDGDVVRWASGETDWTTVSLSLTSGSHTLKWIYWKDESDADGEDCAYLDQVVWTSSMPSVIDPIPDIGEEPTEAAVQGALAGSEDDRLSENITDGETYNAYREWANKVELPSGGKAGAQAVKDSPNAWLSFAIDSATLIETLPQDGDMKIETFEQTATSGSYDFTVSVDNIMVGEDAEPSNLAKVFGIEGGTSLEPGGLSSENVNITFGTPENGKVKFTAGPKDVETGTFFMRVKMTP